MKVNSDFRSEFSCHYPEWRVSGNVEGTKFLTMMWSDKDSKAFFFIRLKD